MDNEISKQQLIEWAEAVKRVKHPLTADDIILIGESVGINMEVLTENDLRILALSLGYNIDFTEPLKENCEENE